MNPWYPSIDVKGLVPLQVIRENLERDADYLSRDDCPYPAEVKSLVTRLLGGIAGPGSASATFFVEGENQEEAVLREIDRIYTDALALERELKVTDASEKIQLLKARGQLLQRLVDMKAQTMNIKAMAEFQEAVIGFMEDVLTPDQVTDFMQRIRRSA